MSNLKEGNKARMQLEVGAVMSGKVSRLTKFGAFVELENGKVGLVHISEISNCFVRQVEDHLSPGQEVKVKVVSVAENGKIELSIKRLSPPAEKQDLKREEQRKKASANRFEDMMSKFKRLSDDKLLDFKKKSEPRKNRSSYKNGI